MATGENDREDFRTHADGDEEEEMDPFFARSSLVDQLTSIQKKLTALVMLRSDDSRRDRIVPLRAEIAEIKENIAQLDEIISLSVAPIPSPAQSTNLNSKTNSDSIALDNYKAPARETPVPWQLHSSRTAAGKTTRLPSTLPIFRGKSSSKIVYADNYIETLHSALMAHDVDDSR